MTATTCASCGAPAGSDDEFCEACGRPVGQAPGAGAAPTDQPSTPADASTESDRTHLLAAPNAQTERSTQPTPAVSARTCEACGGAVGDDGWCTVCGARAGNGRDHTTDQPSATVAGVCDRGQQHPRNEDAMALAVDDHHVVLVVCDGVTTATDSDAAALAASQSACASLAAASPAAADSPAARIDHWAKAIEAAGRAANDSVVAGSAAVGTVENPPSCTLAAVVIDDDLITAGWVGDSRAYWFGDDGTAEQLSTDDSWATEQISAGVPREVAEADPKAHAITRWLGIDGPPGPPSTSATTATVPGWVLVCTDGLWNYCSGAADLGALVHEHVARSGLDPLALADALVTWANHQGGHDNITAAVARVVPSLTQPKEP